MTQMDFNCFVLGGVLALMLLLIQHVLGFRMDPFTWRIMAIEAVTIVLFAICYRRSE